MCQLPGAGVVIVVVVIQPQSFFAPARKPRTIAQFRKVHMFVKSMLNVYMGTDRRRFFAALPSGA